MQGHPLACTGFEKSVEKGKREKTGFKPVS